MQYVILVLGLFVIYFALKKDKPIEKGNLFSSMLDKKMNNPEADRNDIEILRNQVVELMIRVEDLEKSLFLVEEKYKNQMQPKIEPDITVSESKKVKEKESEEKLVEKTVEGDVNLKIYELYDSGKSLEEISSILRIGKGEVSLRLGLRKHR